MSSNRIRTWLDALYKNRGGLIAAVLSAAALLMIAAAFYIMYQRREEPPSLFGGISIWPAEMLRAASIALSILFLSFGVRDLNENARRIAGEFGITDGLEARAERAKWTLKALLKNIFFSWENEDTNFNCCYRGDTDQRKSIKVLWCDYMRRSSGGNRIIRILLLVLVYACLGFLTVWLFGKPARPIRGEFSLITDTVVLALSVLSFLVLTFFVVDATRLFRTFIDHVTAHAPDRNGLIDTFMKAETAGGKAPEYDAAMSDILGEWMIVKLVARRTEAVGKLIFYPFIIWFVLFLSRLQFFHNWDTPLHLVLVISLTAVYAWSCALILRRAAERGRSRVIERLSLLRLEEQSKRKPESGRLQLIVQLLDDVGNIKQGAFAPYMQHPVVQALLVPFGGTLLEIFTKISL